MSNITHFVFDLETLGILTDSVVLSIGVVPFQFENPTMFSELVGDGIHLKLSVEDQMRTHKRKVDPEVLAWWKTQGADARSILRPSPKDLTMVEALDKLDAFMASGKYSNRNSWVWSRGNLFDFGKLESMYASINRPEPYNVFMERDIRTMVDVLTGSMNGKAKAQTERTGFVPHNALHDAAADACTMTEIFQAMLEG